MTHCDVAMLDTAGRFMAILRVAVDEIDVSDYDELLTAASLHLPLAWEGENVGYFVMADGDGDLHVLNNQGFNVTEDARVDWS